MQLEAQMADVPAGTGTMPVFVARPDGAGPLPVVLVVMEAFGLNPHIKDVARRLAAEGYVAVAPDLYWRGGANRVAGYDQLPQAMALMQSLRDDEVTADLRSVIAWLGRQPFARADRVGITGFCMGGRVSFLAACELPGAIRASAPFYGGGIPVDRTAKLACPLLAFFGERDAYIPLATVEALRGEMARHGKQGEVVVYPGADHGFFCNDRASYQGAAAEDAWRRLKRFLATHLRT